MKPQEMALSPLSGLLHRLQILIGVSVAHLLKNAWKIFDERFKVQRLGWRNREKSEEKKKKYANISDLQEPAAVKSSSLLTHSILQTQLIVNHC